MADVGSAQRISTPELIWPGGPSSQGPHRVEAFATCPQLEAFSHDLHLRPSIEKDALMIGTLVHVGTAYRYGLMLSPRPDWLVYPDARTAIWTLGWGSGRGDAAAEALRIFDAYEAFYKVNVWRPLLVEHQFKVEMEGEPYTARIDLLAVDEYGQVALIDHKCLPGDSVVFTRVGPRRVDELLTGWEAAAWDGACLRWAKAHAAVSAGIQDIYQIRTRSGMVARYGWKHPVLTNAGFVQAVNLSVGMIVAVAGRLPDLPDAPIADPVIALAGLLIGDGALKYGIVYTKEFRPFREYFKACFREAGAVEGDYNERFPSHRVPYIQVRRHAAPIEALRALGLCFVGSADKRIPRSLLSCSHRQVGVLLGALWSSDGAMYIVKEKRRDGISPPQRKVRIVYGSRSYGLCLDIHGLFLRLGICATVTSSSVLYKGARRGYHFTTVVGRESKRRFLELVISGFIRRPAGKEIAKDLLMTLDETLLRGKNPTLDGDILWDPIESVLYAGKEPTYDIEVPGLSTFVADGLVTHNTVRELSKNIGRSYRTDRQMLTGLALARSAGYDVRRVIINALSKERPTPQFWRYDVPVSEVAYKRLGDDTRYYLKQMTAVRLAYPDTTNRPRTYGSCIRKFGLCDFYPLCSDGLHRIDEFVKR